MCRLAQQQAELHALVKGLVVHAKDSSAATARVQEQLQGLVHAVTILQSRQGPPSAPWSPGMPPSSGVAPVAVSGRHPSGPLAALAGAALAAGPPSSADMGRAQSTMVLGSDPAAGQGQGTASSGAIPVDRAHSLLIAEAGSHGSMTGGPGERTSRLSSLLGAGSRQRRTSTTNGAAGGAKSGSAWSGLMFGFGAGGGAGGSASAPGIAASTPPDRASGSGAAGAAGEPADPSKVGSLDQAAANAVAAVDGAAGSQHPPGGFIPVARGDAEGSVTAAVGTPHSPGPGNSLPAILDAGEGVDAGHIADTSSRAGTADARGIGQPPMQAWASNAGPTAAGPLVAVGMPGSTTTAVLPASAGSAAGVARGSMDEAPSGPRKLSTWLSQVASRASKAAGFGGKGPSHLARSGHSVSSNAPSPPQSTAGGTKAGAAAGGTMVRAPSKRKKKAKRSGPLACVPRNGEEAGEALVRLARGAKVRGGGPVCVARVGVRNDGEQHAQMLRVQGERGLAPGA